MIILSSFCHKHLIDFNNTSHIAFIIDCYEVEGVLVTLQAGEKAVKPATVVPARPGQENNHIL